MCGELFSNSANPFFFQFGQYVEGTVEEQGGLACCDSWGRKESDTTERLNWTEQSSDILWSMIAVHFYKMQFCFVFLMRYRQCKLAEGWDFVLFTTVP